MVEDSITDGKRIAQLLASEITGLQRGRLATLSIEEANPDAMPSDTGTLAYQIVAGQSALADVSLYPSYIELEFTDTVPEQSLAGSVDGEGVLTVNHSIVQVTSGAKVKDAVDLIRHTIESRYSA